MKKLPLLLAFLLLAGISTKSEAAVIQYTDFSDFYSVNRASNDFESGIINTSYLTFDNTASIGSSSMWTGNVTSSGSYGLVDAKDHEPLTILTSQSAYEVGMYFGNDNWGSFDAILNVYDAANNLLGGVAVTANINDYADQFIGLYSDIAFTRVDISYTRPGAQGLSNFIDDVTVGFDSKTAPVPEPCTILLLGSGLVGLVASRKKFRA